MHNLNLTKLIVRPAALAVAAALFTLTARAETVTNKFGFTGPEVFPIDNQISLLRSADLDGDGKNDLIVVNNSRSKINLLYNQTGCTNCDVKAKATGRKELNDLPGDARFRLES